MRLKAFIPFLVLVFIAFALWVVVPWWSLVAWASDAQRTFQNSMARGLTAVRAGDLSVIWALCSATAAYGFVHALGPGHGKVLLGGAALASGATLTRMTVLTVVSSLAQAGTAILLVGVLAAILGMTAAQIGPIADQWLAPASYIAIAALGLYLFWRGIRQWHPKAESHDHHHHDHDHKADGSCCGHAHGPTLKEVEALGSFREAVMLVASIAIRPCTGAIFVLVIALRFDVFWVGCLAVITMGLGTAAFNLIVALSGVAARRLSFMNTKSGESIARVSACVQMFGGSIIMLFSVLWLLRFWG